MSSRLNRFAGGAAAITVSLGAGAAYINHEFGPETLPRMGKLYRVAIPGFLAYKRVQLLEDEWRKYFGLPVDEDALNRTYEALHTEWAPRGLAIVLELRGFNLKTGQLVASNFGDAFPRTWQKTFEPLLDRVPACDFATVRETVEKGLGKKIEDVFSRFETEPLASASIGQVHRATLRATGERVVVKVMYPEVESRFRGDLLAAKRFVAVAMPEHLEPLSEIEKQFANEFDYTREASQLELVRSNLAKPRARAFKDIMVPKPHLELCSKMVLVMSEIPNAKKLTTALEEDILFFAKREGISSAAFIERERAADQAALARGELRCGPSAKVMDSWANQLRWVNWFRGWVGLPPSHVPLNHAALVDTLFQVHAHEILVDGAFNGDPHPGNILVTRSGTDPSDKSSPPRLALVDYGQVKILRDDQRLALARLIVALARAPHPPQPHHEKEVARHMRALGWKSAKSDDAVTFANARLFFDRDDAIISGGKNTQAYIESLEARDRRVSLGDFVLAGRASLMLRGLGHMLNQHRSAAQAWAPIAESVLKEAGEKV